MSDGIYRILIYCFSSSFFFFSFEESSTFRVHGQCSDQCDGRRMISAALYDNNGRFFLPLSLIMKTCLYSFDSLKPHFYIVKLGFKWVNIVFRISAQKHRLWVLVRTASA